LQDIEDAKSRRAEAPTRTKVTMRPPVHRHGPGKKRRGNETPAQRGSGGMNPNYLAPKKKYKSNRDTLKR